jgi:hypothetical protein
MMRFILAAAALLLLAGCATTSPSSTVSIDLPALPPNISAPCASPVTLPTADTGRQDVERYWATDRTNLAKCGASHAAAVSSYEAVRAELAGAK